MTTGRTFLARVLLAFSAIATIYGSAYSQETRFTSQPDKEEKLIGYNLLTDPQKRRPSDEEESRTTNSPRQVTTERNQKMELEFRYWIVNSRASVNVRENINGLGGGIKAGIDLDSKNSPDARFTWQITRRNKLRVDYLQTSITGDTANFALNLGGIDLLSGVNVNTDLLKGAELKLKQLRMGYAWQGFKLGNRIKLGPSVEARGILFDASLKQQPSTNSGISNFVGNDRGRFGLAMLTLGADVNIVPHRRVEIASAISGIPIAGLGRVFDADTVVKFSLQKNINLSTGYRYLRLRAHEGSNFAELRLRGPVIGAGFRF
jgi:hypothetical protein